MSPSTDTKFKVEPFDGSNYSLWSYKMKMYLMSKGLWDAVSGEAEVASAKEQQAHAAIVLNLNDSQLMHVVTSKTAKEAWDTLKTFHKTQDMANRLWLKEKFSAFKFTASSVSNHVTELEKLVMDMKNAGCEPSEEDVCATMLRSLPSSYESLVQAFRMSVSDFKLADLVSKLIAEEVRQKDSTRVEEATALLAGKGNGKQQQKKKNTRGGRKKGFSGACFNCGKMGHYARDCRSRASPDDSIQDQSNVAFNATGAFASESWVMDSGASAHMCKTRDAFHEYSAIKTARSILSAKNSANLKILGFGTVVLRVWTGSSWINARLENTLHVEDLNTNLFSLTAATARGMTVTMDSERCVVKRGSQVVATGRKQGKLMYLNTDGGEECHVAENDVGLWHRRLGHVSFSTLNSMVKDGKLSGAQVAPGTVCGVCATAKQARKPFSSTEKELEARESARNDTTVCSDVLGPVTPASKSGYKYIVSFILMKSRFVTIYPLRKKSEVCEAFKKFLKEAETSAGIKVKVLRSDNGGEYCNAAMETLCDDKMVKQEFTVPYNPQQNGMAERMNRTLVEMTRCMLKESGIDKSYWCEAMMTAADIRNVLPNTSNPHSSPFQLVYKREPRLEHMRVFGTECYAHVTKQKRKKLDDSGIKCVFLGYAKQHKAYRLVDPTNGSIVISRSVTFAEAPLATARKEGSQEVIDIIGNDEEEERTEEPSVEEGFRTPQLTHAGNLIITAGRLTLCRRDEYPGTRRGEFNLDDFEGEFDSLYCLLTEDDDGERAVSYDEVMRSKYKDEWLRAMESEMKSLEDHRTWTLVDMPSDKKAIGCKWVFRIKRDPSGKIIKFKARLVAKGFTQRPGVDYTETFAPVARKESINMVVAIAAEEDMEAENVDVDTAFLYGDVDEELYMDQPDGFEDQSNPTKKCLLMQALYGTKQAARQWNSKLNKHLESQGFRRSAADPCVYVRRSGSKFSIIVVYVDDLMIFSKTKADITGIKEALKREFSIKELGELKYCLGIEIHRDRESKVIIMNQRAYIQRLAEKFGVENCKAVHTPADSNSKLVKPSEDEVFAPKYPYRELVGALMYLATCTRPDIAQAVGEVAKFCEYYNKSHWVAAKRILKYLKTTQDLGLVFNGRTKGELFGYADANWAGDLDTRRSTTGYVFFLNGSAISWKSKRQPTVATSSTEAEYMALYNATQEAVWLRQLLKDVGAECVGATTIFQDNQGCIALAKNPAYHSRTKHIHLKYHFLREKVEDKIIVLEYKPTDEMVADGFTKALARPKHRQFIVGLGMDD
ncbi:Retrovirus-related Pol polyprotein from transposon TNT 1-94 [Phytophthora cinnamomi]|uniref:Retrovirus-related Pol polyprotein from transposon TNT 1-94 n=1 Tax=Phytophthora cinnamomi TaxID=4785 RepID=UPI003559FCEA|nr:Retrovirus-related Pol polyprotein from transposon TNT 1-94 [Phytophthora cinnamomi]